MVLPPGPFEAASEVLLGANATPHLCSLSLSIVPLLSGLSLNELNRFNMTDGRARSIIERVDKGCRPPDLNDVPEQSMTLNTHTVHSQRDPRPRSLQR